MDSLVDITDPAVRRAAWGALEEFAREVARGERRRGIRGKELADAVKAKVLETHAMAGPIVEAALLGVASGAPAAPGAPDLPGAPAEVVRRRAAAYAAPPEKPGAARGPPQAAADGRTPGQSPPPVRAEPGAQLAYLRVVPRAGRPRAGLFERVPAGHNSNRELARLVAGVPAEAAHAAACAASIAVLAARREFAAACADDPELRAALAALGLGGLRLVPSDAPGAEPGAQRGTMVVAPEPPGGPVVVGLVYREEADRPAP
jgi:hypothetical protein